MRRIITVGREFGSGGREIGRRIAEELQIAYYDQEIITEIAKKNSAVRSIYPADRGETSCCEFPNSHLTQFLSEPRSYVPSGFVHLHEAA